MEVRRRKMNRFTNRNTNKLMKEKEKGKNHEQII